VRVGGGCARTSSSHSGNPLVANQCVHSAHSSWSCARDGLCLHGISPRSMCMGMCRWGRAGERDTAALVAAVAAVASGLVHALKCQDQ
jgi:hypothetical protein